jgi:zinc and cadmium transporter
VAVIATTPELMSVIALFGSVTLALRESTLQKILLPLVSFAAGSLIGSASRAPHMRYHRS